MSYSPKFALALLLLVGCGPAQDAPPSPAPTDVTSTAPTAIDPTLIELVEGKMVRSKTFRLDGDLRPFWIVSGRIRNHSALELRNVTFKISINSRATSSEVDTANLAIDTDILPGSIGSFSREIQILPPNGGWDWSYAVIRAVPK